MLRGHEGLDERVGGLRVEREGVAQRRQLGAALQERLLQPVAAGVEVLLDGKHKPRRNVTGPAPLVAAGRAFPPGSQGGAAGGTDLDGVQRHVHDGALPRRQAAGVARHVVLQTRQVPSWRAERQKPRGFKVQGVGFKKIIIITMKRKV